MFKKPTENVDVKKKAPVKFTELKMTMSKWKTKWMRLMAD